MLAHGVSLRRAGRGIPVLVLLLASCRTLPVTPQHVLDELERRPGAHLTGTPLGLARPVVLNAEDFVYDARPSPDGRSVAVSRLGMKQFFLSIFTLGGPPVPRVDVPVNTLEFDVEALDFSPDGKHVATVSRDGAVRVFDAGTGALTAALGVEEPLASVAFDATGTLLAAGSTRGLLVVLAWPGLTHVAEARPHADEVRAVAFAPDGRLFSGGWDKRLVSWRVAEVPGAAKAARVHFEKKGALLLFRGVLNGRASATLTPDARVPAVVVRGALAQAAGIDATALAETVQIPGAYGAQVAKVARNQVLSFKGLVLDGVDVAVCDACVPQDAQGVLGGPVLERLDYAADDTTREVVLTAKPGAAGVTMASSKALSQEAAFTFEAAVNDVSVDAAGSVLGVALSETKAQRNREVYEREKKGEVEPERPWDCGARVDSRTGAVLERRHGHRGVVATAGISPDGATLVTGGWDKKVLLHGAGELVPEKFGWAVRRVRFSRDGRRVVVAAWTPQNPLGSHQSDPSAVVYDVAWQDVKVAPPK